MRRRGFTLLELLIVIIIVGVMATLGLTQYNAVVERSRGAEARQILGQLRSVCAALYMETNTNTNCTAANLGIGAPGGANIPNACAGQASHFFSYGVAAVGLNAMNFVATRCAAGGKPPVHVGGGTLTLNSDYAAGTTLWTSPNGY